MGCRERLISTGGRRPGAFAAVLPVLLAGGLSLADGPPAGPSGGALGCGAVVTRDVTLSSDLRGCHGDGLVVGADSVTVDLGGHTVSGDGRAGSPDADTGIRVVGHRDVRIVHGTVSRFDVGIGGSSAPRLAVTEVTVGDTHRGVAVADGSHDARIEDSRFVAIGDAAGGAAVLVVDSSRARVVRNVMRESHSGVAVTAAGATVADNVVTDSSFAGVELTFATGGRVSGNTIRGAACGICLEGADRNTVGHNVITGLTAPDGIGISLYGSGNDVLANRVTGSVRYAIEVDDFQEAGHTPVSGNDVRDNVVRGGPASVDGITVGPEGGGTVLRTAVIANRVTGFSDDGIRIGGASSGLETTRVAGNTVVGSGNLAIEAVPGVADGGGNRALRTGSLVPCLGVACRSTGPRVESFVYMTAGAGDVQAVWGADRSGAHQITEPGACAAWTGSRSTRGACSSCPAGTRASR
ncbi:putative Cell surface protein [Nostocoides japonicum T1-X7]|uniref:Putative Cell surface protein n=1 Tax=Nostocoides japonicum T1-X7 TaxID=1194083 RepID=A0A077LU82_9MICO|nr:right-handed parallel beta-helix repeat-containing protein [Tetrasphaera japonica]CCH77308.1 putative Cell surface protein [Tetrasphaera japonica T1-X7]